ncbi:haloacid dehalogenase [Tricladium varicosporioides]|nr:haloacid dehalogenase [Hymenoscyphus varicosporioides]
MARPNLLLCFDAFGTLFRPRRLVAQQYGEVARQCGLAGFSDDKLQLSLRAAIKDETKQNPNYGRATGLGATRWWTNVIHKTFTPLMENDEVLPTDLAPKLLHRFSSDEGYNVEPNLVSTLKALKHQSRQRCFDRIVIGVVTNSDDRVPSVLSSFGLNISPLRYGTDVNRSAFAGQDYDIDFHCMSYDVGVEKPDSLIFNAAKLMLIQIIATRDGKTPTEAKADVETWRKVYVGDEYTKDVVGAINAGWNPVLLDVNEYSTSIPKLEDYPTQTLDDLFEEHTVVRVRSIQNLTMWLTGGR